MLRNSGGGEGESGALAQAGVQNSLLASTPGHPYWARVIEEMALRAQMASPVEGDGTMGEHIVITTGPGLLSDVARAMGAAEVTRQHVVLLSPEDVAPYGWAEYVQEVWVGGA